MPQGGVRGQNLGHFFKFIFRYSLLGPELPVYNNNRSDCTNGNLSVPYHGDMFVVCHDSALSQG